MLVALSGRNRLTGVVEEVRRDGLLAQVRLRVGDQSLTAVITRDAVDAVRGLQRTTRVEGRRQRCRTGIANGFGTREVMP